MAGKGAFNKILEFLGLRVSEQERLRYAHDPYNIFEDPISNDRPLRVAAVAALLVHLVLFIITFPKIGDKIYTENKEIVRLTPLADPGGGGSPKSAPPKPQPTLPKPQAAFVPIPDPTPDAPEPIRKIELDITPDIRAQVSNDINIGDIQAPPGIGGTGGAPGRSPGSGGSDGGGSRGPYGPGPGVTNPVLIHQTIPSYTDEAIKAKIQGIVLLQAIVRKDGTIDSFKVLRGLGYGLDEKAIQEISTKWRFRPGTLNGRPVDVLAHIEVTFNLR